jgi:hypothetical protein
MAHNITINHNDISINFCCKSLDNINKTVWDKFFSRKPTILDINDESSIVSNGINGTIVMATNSCSINIDIPLEILFNAFDKYSIGFSHQQFLNMLNNSYC